MEVHVIKDIEPQALAMLQALYSRSHESVAVNAEKVREQGSDKFLSSYYVGYGHASIGECGPITLFFEDVSMLFAKAIQDHPLYKGVETSSRYLDFSTRPCVNSFTGLGVEEEAEADALQRRLLDLYNEAIPNLTAHIERTFPIQEGQDENVWRKAISARCFDILRSLLPAGVTTKLSWSTDLRVAKEHLSNLEFHPLREVREGAIKALKVLKKSYPAAFSHKEVEGAKEYLNKYLPELFYKSIHIQRGERLSEDNPVRISDDINYTRLNKFHAAALRERPKGVMLPRVFDNLGRYQCEALVDFGCMRDLQRHRNGLFRMPLLTSNYGFHNWYLDEMPYGLAAKVSIALNNYLNKLSKLGLSKYDEQYMLPLGMKVVCSFNYTLPQMVYVSELRSRLGVHPILRAIATKMGRYIANSNPNIKIHLDETKDAFDYKRGLKDITKREGY